MANQHENVEFIPHESEQHDVSSDQLNIAGMNSGALFKAVLENQQLILRNQQISITNQQVLIANQQSFAKMLIDIKRGTTEFYNRVTLLENSTPSSSRSQSDRP